MENIRKKLPISEEEAKAIAIFALAHIAGDDEILERFLAITGLNGEDLSENITNPAFLVGVLDFFMQHEPSLIEFCEAREINPENIAIARELLNGPEPINEFSDL